MRNLKQSILDGQTLFPKSIIFFKMTLISQNGKKVKNNKLPKVLIINDL